VPDVERPKSPWTPSYAVTTLGSDSLETPGENELMDPAPQIVAKQPTEITPSEVDVVPPVTIQQPVCIPSVHFFIGLNVLLEGCSRERFLTEG